jgi:hypothetical protein
MRLRLRPMASEHRPQPPGMCEWAVADKLDFTETGQPRGRDHRLEQALRLAPLLLQFTHGHGRHALGNRRIREQGIAQLPTGGSLGSIVAIPNVLWMARYQLHSNSPTSPAKA